LLLFKTLLFFFKASKAFENASDILTPTQRQAAMSIIIKVAMTNWDISNPSGRDVAFKDLLPAVAKVKIIDKSIRGSPPGTVTPGTVTPGTVTPGTVTPGTVTREKALTAWFQADAEHDITVQYVNEPGRMMYGCCIYPR
jgi:hypothetical protein